MATEKREMTVGGVVVGVLALALALSYGGRDLAAKTEAGFYRIDAAFNRVDGLLSGDEVRLGGIKIGTVAGMRLDENFRAILSLRIDSDVQVPTDSSAAIQTSGLFGSKYVVIQPGGEDAVFKPGERITFTQDATIVSELMDLIIAEGRARNAATETGSEKKER